MDKHTFSRIIFTLCLFLPLLDLSPNRPCDARPCRPFPHTAGRGRGRTRRLRVLGAAARGRQDDEWRTSAGARPAGSGGAARQGPADTTRSKKLLGAPGIATRSKDATRSIHIINSFQTLTISLCVLEREFRPCRALTPS